MKKLKYKYLYAEIKRGTEEEPIIEQIIREKSIDWNEANEEIAKKEAYNCVPEIYDDGHPEPEPKQTPEERIAELEEALALLLSGVTE